MKRLQEELLRLVQSGKIDKGLIGIGFKDMDALKASINSATGSLRDDPKDAPSRNQDKNLKETELDLRSDAFNALRHLKEALEQLRVYVLPKGSLVPVDVAELVTKLEHLNRTATQIVSDPYKPDARNLNAYTFGEETSSVKKQAA